MSAPRIATQSRFRGEARAIGALLLVVLLTGCWNLPVQSIRVDPAQLVAPASNAITFWGHSTCYIDMNGVGLITDPVLATAYSPWHRRQVPAPPASAYAHTRYILISHAHRDHLNTETLTWLPDSAIVLCPQPCAGIVAKTGRHVQVMKPGDSCVFDGGAIIAVMAHHPGGRNSLKPREDGNAIGFIIRTPGRTIYYSGDTEYFEGLSTIGQTYHPDIALLNVNGHLPADDAVRATFVLGASHVIPIHSSAYSGPTAKKNVRLRAEYTDMVGNISVPLAIGESFDLKRQGIMNKKAPRPQPAEVPIN